VTDNFIPEYVYKGKKCSGFIEELNTFKNMNRLVFLSLDFGETKIPMNHIMHLENTIILTKKENSSPTIKILGLIEVLKQWPNDSSVTMSINTGETILPISMVGNDEGDCLISNHESDYT
jgi:hypothetical protein